MVSADLLRAVMRRAVADRVVVLVAATLLLAASTLLSAAAVYADVVGAGGLRRAILAAPARDRAIVVTAHAMPGEVDRLGETIVAGLDTALGSVGGEIALVLQSEPLERTPAESTEVARSGGDSGEVTASEVTPAAGASADSPSAEITYLTAHAGIRAHGRISAGRWPSPGGDPMEVALSEGAARSLGLAVGETLSLTSRLSGSRSVQVKVTGIWQPDRADPYWLGSAVDVDGVEMQSSLVVRGPFEADAADLVRFASGASVDASWRALPAFSGLNPGDVEPLRDRVEEFAPRLMATLGGGRASVASGLSPILETAGRSVVVSGSGVLLVTLQFGMLALYAVVLVATLLHERRRGEIAFLRARGARREQIAAMAAAEGLLFAAPAALVAPLLAVPAVSLLGSLGPLTASEIVADVEVTPASVAVSVCAALAGAAIFALPSVVTTMAPEAVRRAFGRSLGSSLGERLALDLVLVVAAIIALWQIRVHGSPLRQAGNGALTMDPLLVIGPAVGMFAAGLLAIRVIPRAAELGERFLAAMRGLVPPLGARQLARRPVRYTRAVLLVLLAAALSAFAAAYGATWTRSQSDQAAYRSAADVRATSSEYPTLPAWSLSPLHRSLPGVRADLAAVRGSLDAGRAVGSAEVLAVDAATAPGIVHFPADTEASAKTLLATLASHRPTIATFALDGRPQRIELLVDAHLGQAPGIPSYGVIPEVWRAVRAAVTMLDGDGRLQRFAGESALAQGDRQLVTVPLVAVVDGRTLEPAYPLQLVTIELTVTTPSGVTAVGTVELLGAGAVADPDPTTDGDDSIAQRIPLESMTGRWTWLRSDADGTRECVPSPAAPRRMIVDESDPIGGTLGAGDTTFRFMSLPAGSGGPLAVIAGDRFLEASGVSVGEELTVTAMGQRLDVRIVGSVAMFPPLDPARPFLVVDDPTIEMLRLATTGPTLVPTEWWLSVEGDEGPVIEALLRAPFSAGSAVGRGPLARELSGGPIGLAVIGALVLGAVAAALLAAIGFLVAAAASIAERHGEFALLRALGLSPRQLSAWLSAENGLMLAFGLAAGVAIGLLIAWLVLPFQVFTEEGSAAVPALHIVVPWEALVPLLLLGLALMAISTAVAVREVGGISISDVLRTGDR